MPSGVLPQVAESFFASSSLNDGAALPFGSELWILFFRSLSSDDESPGLKFWVPEDMS